MKQIPLTQGKHAIVDDDDFEEIGKFKWTIQRDGRHSYAYRRDYSGGTGVKVFLHRTIMKTPAGMCVDHIDGDGLNNQKTNMRNCENRQNVRNQIPRENCTSIYKGVCWHKQMCQWAASINPNRTKKHLGLFNSEEAAARAYNAAAIRYFGEFARLNAV